MTTARSLEDRLTIAFEQLADETNVESSSPALSALPQSDVSEHRDRFVGIAAAALVAVGIGGIMWVTQLDPDRSASHGEPSEAGAAAADPRSAEPMLMVPVDLAGFDLRSSSVTSREDAPRRTLIRLAERRADGTLTTHALVQRTAEQYAWLGDPSATEHPHHVAEERAGDRDVVVLHDPTNQHVEVVYRVGDGTTITASQPVDVDASEIVARLLGLVEVTEPSGELDMTIGRLANGVEIVFHGDPADAWGPSSHLSYRAAESADSRTSGLHGLQITTIASDHPALPFTMMLDDLHPVEVRERSGYATTHRYPSDGLTAGATNTIVWSERPGHWVMVTGDNVAIDELIEIATKLKPVSESEWDAYTSSHRRPGTDPSDR